jgi:asparagine synthase (glutamine-hydrolysing)
VAWVAEPTTPFEVVESPRRTTALFGDALAGSPSRRLSAAAWAEHLEESGDTPLCDGLHLAVSVSDDLGWIVASDILGILPVYCVVLPEARMVATSPGLFRAHEQFRDALNPVALTSLLLTNGLLEGETIFRDVRRVPAGHAIAGRTGDQPRELPRYRIPVEPRHHHVPLEECSYRLHEALVSACARQVAPGVPHALLLSGGLDSRLLAGILARQGAPIEAVTRGLSTDEDYRCARRVARHLGIPHRLVEDTSGDWRSFQDRLTWDGMTTSPGIGGGSVGDSIRGVAPRSVSGYLMDAIVGGSHIRWCYSVGDHATSFETMLRRLNLHGIQVDTLRTLLRKDVFGDSVDQVIHQAREVFRSLGETDLERAWRFDLAHRQRFQIGSLLVRQMPAAWPCAPHVDTEVLATAGGIPLGMLAERVVERDILVRFHNDLARLPIDRGTIDTMPIDPDVLGVLRQVPDRLARRIRRALDLKSRERRYYHRTFDLDGAAWLQVRREAESAREAAYAWFDRETFDRLLPRPGQPWPTGFKHVDTIGRKTLLGAAALVAAVGAGALTRPRT